MSARYPDAAGWKRDGASRDAAEALAPSLSQRQRDVLGALLERGPMTGDECASALGLDLLSARPRLSELVLMELVEATDERRPGIRFPHITQTVWRAVGQHAGNDVAESSQLSHATKSAA